MDKTVRFQPAEDGQVIAKFRQHGVTVDYAELDAQDLTTIGDQHDLTGPIEVNAVRLLLELDERQKTGQIEKRSPLHAMLRIFTGAHRR